MYSPNSSVLSTIHDHPLSTSTFFSASSSNNASPQTTLTKHHQHHPSAAILTPTSQSTNAQCLRFKYFTTFFICTTCLALLSASLATHKWIISRPIRILRLSGGGGGGSSGAQTNFTSLMLTVASLDDEQQRQESQQNLLHRRSRHARQYQQQMSSNSQSSSSSAAAATTSQQQQQQQNKQDSILLNDLLPMNSIGQHSANNNKFQGEIYFGLFNGVKVLNYGFGDRVSQLSVTQSYFSRGSTQQELINFKLWLPTLIGVALAILFALIGSIFAIINFVMTPRGSLTGPVGLVIWNAAACFSCLLALVSWLIEYFVRLKANVLTSEEVQNGWTSENRSQFGYSYYFVVLAFVLHLVNIFIVSIVQFETWTSNKAAKRQSQAACEGVIMLY